MRRVSTGTGVFDDAVARLASVQVRPDFVLREAPAPQRLAPSTVAVTAEMADPESDLVSGRFVLLHDPDGVDEWEGSFRAVVFVRAELEADLLHDDLLHDVGWSWVTESLSLWGCHVSQLGGTVTRTAGRSFGTMVERPDEGFVEIRASWTPSEGPEGLLIDDFDAHASAWLDLMAMSAGLPPLPSDVGIVPHRRARARS